MCCFCIPKPQQDPDNDVPHARRVSTRRLQRAVRRSRAKLPVASSGSSTVKEVNEEPEDDASIAKQLGASTRITASQGEFEGSSKELPTKGSDKMARDSALTTCEDVKAPAPSKTCESCGVSATLSEPFQSPEFLVEEKRKHIQDEHEHEPDDWSRGCRSTMPSVRRRLREEADKQQGTMSDTTQNPSSVGTELPAQEASRPATYAAGASPRPGRSPRTDKKRRSWTPPTASRWW